jgi:lipopolysaccharide assembly protein A
MLIILLLILAVLLALGISLFAMQNPDTVRISIATLSWDNVPIFIVVLISLLLGLVVAWIFGLLSSISSSITLFGKDAKLKRTNDTIDKMKEKINSLEQENNNLKTRLRTT